MEWTGLEWWNGMEWNGGAMIEYAHDSSLNRIASHVNNILVILVRGGGGGGMAGAHKEEVFIKGLVAYISALHQ